MPIISLFNNKGGVGKTTLSYHLSSILAEMGKKVLIADMDPQCNLTMHAVELGRLQKIWDAEDDFVEDGYESARQRAGPEKYEKMLSQSRTIHFLLKPTEEGAGEHAKLPPPFPLRKNLDLLPGRMTLYMYENTLAERWSGAYLGHPLSIRTITAVRSLLNNYIEQEGYDYVILDTSPSLGALNKVVISTADAFLIPCLPDLFSLYGIRNIGKSLGEWRKEFATIRSLLSGERRKSFPDQFVRFLGYTLYNAKKNTGGGKGLVASRETQWNLAKAHYNFAEQIPEVIEAYIDEGMRSAIPGDVMQEPIGSASVMHSHNTFTSMAQRYRVPIWKTPDCRNLTPEDKRSIGGHRGRYYETKKAYTAFAEDVLRRMEMSGLGAAAPGAIIPEGKGETRENTAAEGKG